MDLQKLAAATDIVARGRASIKNRLDLIQKDLEDMRAHETEFERMASVLAGLRTSWRVPDPRPRGFAQWFFVRNLAFHRPFGYTRVERCERFWIKELLDDPVEAEKILAQNLLGTSGEMANWQFMASCKPHPGTLVVGCNERVANGHFGEEWELRIYTFCLHCPAMTLICRHVDDHEFAFA